MPKWLNASKEWWIGVDEDANGWWNADLLVGDIIDDDDGDDEDADEAEDKEELCDDDEEELVVELVLNVILFALVGVWNELKSCWCACE